MEEVGRSLEPESRGLGRGDQIGYCLILYPLILAFSLGEKGLLRSRRDSQNQGLIESYRYVNGTAVIHFNLYFPVPGPGVAQAVATDFPAVILPTPGIAHLSATPAVPPTGSVRNDISGPGR